MVQFPIIRWYHQLCNPYLQVFQKLAAEKKGRVSVFYCGPPTITKILKAKCAKYKFEFRREHF